MSVFKLHTLKEKLWAIVFSSLILRTIVFFSLPSTPTNLAPDEGAYSEITRRIFTGEALGSYGGLFKTSQTLVIPAAIFMRIGLDPLSATRLSALLYGITTLAIAAYVITKMANSHKLKSLKQKNKENLILILFATYSFLPSHLLWGTLALRESTMEFWVILIFSSIFLIMHHSGRSNSFLYLILILSIFLLFHTRMQVGLILVVSLLVSLLFIFKSKNAQKVFIIVAMASALSFSSLFIQINKEFIVVGTGTLNSNTPSPNPAVCKTSGQVILVKSTRFFCKDVRVATWNSITRPDSFIVGQIVSIPDRQKANQANASSNIQTLPCPFENESEINKIGCLLWRAPYMTTTFLTRPIIGLDVTSHSSLFAAVENILWTAGFVIVLYSVVKKKKIQFIKPLWPSLVFFVLYSVGAGSYEGNMGTAFRHKSLILWIVLLLLFAVFWRGQDEEKLPKGNNS